MAEFIKAYQKMILHEGIYSNDPDDPGLRTVMGISEKTWPNWEGWKIVNTLSSEKEMTTNSELQNKVQLFYLINFWNPIKGANIINQEIAESLFDFSVNTGLNTAISIAQAIIGVKNDGIVGAMTISALNACNAELFLAKFTIAKILRYVNIVKKRPVSKKYFYGWVCRAIGV